MTFSLRASTYQRAAHRPPVPRLLRKRLSQRHSLSLSMEISSRTRMRTSVRENHGTDQCDGRRPLGRIEEICSRIRRKISRTQTVEFESIDDYENQAKNSFVWLGLWRCPADSGTRWKLRTWASTLYRWGTYEDLSKQYYSVLTTALTTVWYTEFRCRCSSRESSITKRF